MVLLKGRIVFNNPMQQKPVENGLHGYNRCDTGIYFVKKVIIQ